MVLTPKFFDVHTHTQFATFSEDQDAVIQRALDAGTWMINVGTQKDTSAKAVEVAEKYQEGVYAAVGLHPLHTEKSYHDEKELGGDPSTGSGFTSRGEEFDYDYYKKLAANTKVVAIGECGLDYYRIKNQELIVKQKNVFRKQIELSREIKKSLMIHCRNAFADLVLLLNAKRSTLNAQPGLVHFFSGTKDDAKKLMDLGFSFSFGGVITFTRDYDEVAKYIPLERILLETDAPYVAPVPYRGKRNEPVYVAEVAQKLAELKATDIEIVAQQTAANAKVLFGI